MVVSLLCNILPCLYFGCIYLHCPFHPYLQNTHFRMCLTPMHCSATAAHSCDEEEEEEEDEEEEEEEEEAEEEEDE